MAQPKFTVAICGGAIGGLSLAAFISRHENPNAPVSVDVYESRPNISTRGTGIGIWKRTWQVFQDLGLDEELEKRNMEPPKDGEVRGPVFRKSDQVIDGFTFHNHMMPYGPVTISRPLLLEMLQEKISPHVRIHTGKSLVRYEDPQAGPIVLFFADGSKTVADVLIGADGVHSATRATFFETLAASAHPSLAERYTRCIKPKWSGTYAYRTILPTEKLRDANLSHPALSGPPLIWCGKGKHALTNEQGDITTFGLYYTVKGGEGTEYSGDWIQDVSKQEVVDALKGWEPALQQLLDLSDTFNRWAIHVVEPVPQSVHGRIALLGDAAHAMTPHQGVGGGQAIEDAHMLGRLLAHNATNISNVNHALSIYESFRLPAAQSAAERSRLNGLMYEFDHPDFMFNGEVSNSQLEDLGNAIGVSFRWLADGGCDEDWSSAEKLLLDGRN